MSVNEQTYHLIDQYLAGELKGRALDKFKADMRNDVELQQAVASQQAIIHGIEAHRETELKAYLTEELQKKKTVISMTPKLRLGILTAASIALLAVLIFSLAPLFDQKPTAKTKAIKTSEDTTGLESEEATEELASNETAEPILNEETLGNTSQPEAQDTARMDEIVAMEDDIPAPEVLMEAKDLEEANDATDKFDIDDTSTKILQDEMLLAANYTVSRLSPDFAEVDRVQTDQQVGEVSVVLEKSKPTHADRKEAKKKAAATEESEIEKSITTTRNIRVEYWKSVVNFNGYKYNGSVVQLYGIEQGTPITFKELDNRLYMNIGGKHYFIEQKNAYNKLIKVTNPTLLKVLND